MPHFSADDLDGEDPDQLRRLRALLRGPAAPRTQPPPAPAERFGPGAAEAGGDERGDARPVAEPACPGPRRGAG